MPIFWWTRRGSYVFFIARELTSLAVGWTCLMLLAWAWALAQGPESYERWNDFLRRGPVLVLNALAFAALLFHSVTWLNLAPKAMVVKLGRLRVPDAVLLGAHYAAWVAASALVVWLLVRRG
jgi:fumarate reductase subunit C